MTAKAKTDEKPGATLAQYRRQQAEAAQKRTQKTIKNVETLEWSHYSHVLAMIRALSEAGQTSLSHELGRWTTSNVPREVYDIPYGANCTQELIEQQAQKLSEKLKADGFKVKIEKETPGIYQKYAQVCEQLNALAQTFSGLLESEPRIIYPESETILILYISW